MSAPAVDGPLERPGTTDLDEADLQALADTHRQVVEERVARAAFDAVAELGAAAEAFTVAYLRGDATGDAMTAVVGAMVDAMAAASRAGLQ